MRGTGSEFGPDREGKMAAYAVVQMLEVKDPTGLGEYRRRVGPIIEHYGGTVRVAAGQVHVMEGNWRPALVLIEFDSVERARAWYDSEEYRPLKELRQRAASGDLIIVEGA